MLSRPDRIVSIERLFRVHTVGSKFMSIVVTLSPELEEQLLEKATRQGQDVNLVATELLASMLEWERVDSAAARKGIQQGLDNFKAGEFRSFDEYAAEQRQKRNLHR
jgi:predicted transcriptional regulator